MLFAADSSRFADHEAALRLPNPTVWAGSGTSLGKMAIHSALKSLNSLTHQVTLAAVFPTPMRPTPQLHTLQLEWKVSHHKPSIPVRRRLTNNLSQTRVYSMSNSNDPSALNYEAAPNAQRLLWAGLCGHLGGRYRFFCPGCQCTGDDWSDAFGFTQTELGGNHRWWFGWLRDCDHHFQLFGRSDWLREVDVFCICRALLIRRCYPGRHQPYSQQQAKMPLTTRCTLACFCLPLGTVYAKPW